MVASLALPALFAAGAGGAAAGAAGLTAFGTAALTLGGSVLAAGASGYMEKKELEEKENQRIREEQRQQAAYAGIGDAADFSEFAVDEDDSLLSEQVAETPKVGQLPAAPQRMGDVYKQRAQQKRGNRQPKFQYDRDQGKVQQI